MKKAYITLFILALFMGTVATASADCTKDGKTYQTGDVVGGLVCTADGSWKIK